MLRATRIFLPAVLLLSVLAYGQSAPASGSSGVLPPNSLHSAMDINSAVNFYLAKMPPAQRARSDSYFEGGYWMILWDFLSTVFVMWLLLQFRWSARMRDLAMRITRFRSLQTIVYWLLFLAVSYVALFPMTLYEGYFREHKYGLLNQTFGPWMRDQMVGVAVTLILGAILIVPLFGVVRRVGRSWWIWGAGLMITFLPSLR